MSWLPSPPATRSTQSSFQSVLPTGVPGRPLRVVLITSASDWRGSGISLSKIARGLTARGHSVDVVTTSPAVTDGFLAEGVSAIQLDLDNTAVREVLLLRSLLARQRADAIMADTPRDLRLSVLAGLWPRRPVVYRYNLNYRRPRTDLADRVFALGVSAVVYLSRFIEDDARAAGVSFNRNRSYLIPNGFDTAVFAPDQSGAVAFRRRFGLEFEDPLVVSAGKLTPGKRLERGIQALAHAQALAGPMTYILCGEGPDKVRLTEMAERIGLRVVCTGMLDQSTLRGAYNAAALVLHTARETFGNVVGEAMACGRTVVAVREGAAPEVIGTDGKAGILLPPDDPAGLGEEIVRLLQDPAERERIGSRARHRIEESFSLAAMVLGYEEMFAAVLGSGSTARR